MLAIVMPADMNGTGTLFADFVAALGAIDGAAVTAIESIVLQEREHHDRCATQRHRRRFWSVVIAPVVALATAAAIWFGIGGHR